MWPQLRLVYQKGLHCLWSEFTIIFHQECKQAYSRLKKLKESSTTGADLGFFLGGVALVSRSTSTPINHIVFIWQNTSCIRKPQVISGGGGVRTPCTLLLDPPLHYQYSWSKGPVICLRKDSTSRIIKLKSMADLDELKSKLAIAEG